MLNSRKSHKQWIKTSGLSVLLFCAQTEAANHNFQNFFFSACTGAVGALAERCDETTDSGNQRGDLSGDSEESLAPSQSLSYNVNAIAETRRRINSMLEKIKNQDNEQIFFKHQPTTDREAMDVFRMSGSSVLLQVDSGRYTQDKTAYERGYDKDSNGIKLGLDYRLSDSWLVGMMLGYDHYDQTFDADAPGRNFIPQNNEGESEADNYSISFFTSKNFNENLYVEGMFSYIKSDYTFDRNVIFQVASRNISLNQNVNVSGDTQGNQIAMNFGAGYTHYIDNTSVTVYSRFDYQKSRIDAYTEKGNTGLEMRVEKNTYSESVGTIGLKLAGNFNMSYGILIPQIYVEWMHAFKRDQASSSQYYINDINNIRYAIEGNKEDKNSGNIGFSILTGLPNGWMGYIGASKEFSRDYVSQYRLNAGLRIEF